MTRALVVIGVALSAAGCMTVPGVAPSPNLSPDPAPGPAYPPDPADEDASPPPSQAPVKQALSQPPSRGDALGSGAPREVHAAAPRVRNGPGAAEAHAQEPPGTAHARRSAPPREVQESTARERQHPVKLRLPTPGSSERGVCELGETYGRWDRRSEQSRICRAAYGD